jgi:crossover junction endodeoxyribonuclease RuvC
MIVLGVDPGLARTGVAVVEGSPGRLRLRHAGCIETPAGTPDPDRLALLLGALELLIARERPEAAAVEQLFFSTNRRTAMRVGEARGVILCGLARAGLAVAEYTPLQVKEAVAGWGAAPKPQVARMVRTLLGGAAVEGPDDVADACAVAVCHHHRARLSGAARAPAVTGAGMTAGLAAAVARAGAAPGGWGEAPRK